MSEADKHIQVLVADLKKQIKKIVVHQKTCHGSTIIFKFRDRIHKKFGNVSK